jgi:hypothetical protein
MIYKIVNTLDILGNKKTIIAKYNDDTSVSWIPMSNDNTDYQAYLKWLEEGNTPLPADE